MPCQNTPPALYCARSMNSGAGGSTIRTGDRAEEETMTGRLLTSAALLALLALAQPAMAQSDKPILIGIHSAIQLQVGRDAINGAQMAIDEINEKGGVLGRKLKMITADEGEAATQGPKMGIAAVNKLTGEDHVDVLIGGYDSGVTLGELPH